MSRVLVTGGVGTIGTAVVKHLVADAGYEVRVSDQRTAPQWMREACAVHTGDLRVLDEARKAMKDCSHVLHLAAIVGAIGNVHKLPHMLTEVNNAIFHAALDVGVDRFVYVSSSMVFERAEEFPAIEEYIEAHRHRCRRTASPSSPARSTAARRMTSTACRTRSAAPSTPTVRARCPKTSRASRTPCPT